MTTETERQNEQEVQYLCRPVVSILNTSDNYTDRLSI